MKTRHNFSRSEELCRQGRMREGLLMDKECVVSTIVYDTPICADFASLGLMCILTTSIIIVGHVVWFSSEVVPEVRKIG